jgi:hypothetical protein
MSKIDLKAAVEALEGKATNMGVKLVARAFPYSIDLQFIQRNSGEKGTGAWIMTELCGLADQHGVPITTYVMDFSPVLVEFYERFGFVIDPDGNDEAEMVRPPKT